MSSTAFRDFLRESGDDPAAIIAAHQEGTPAGPPRSVQEMARRMAAQPRRRMSRAELLDGLGFSAAEPSR